MKLDILAFGAHPDDVELGCSGTLLKHLGQGRKTGIVDLTRGELGTRGSVVLRAKEAANAGKLLGISARENMGFSDGFFQNDRKHQLELIKRIRHYRPDIVLTNAPYDRHPDHGRASQLVSESSFYAGLTKIETTYKGKKQLLWRPKAVYHYVQDRYIKPDVVVDISGFFEKKMEVINCYASQFYKPDSVEPETPISTPDFLHFVKARAMQYGRLIGVKYGEGFVAERSVGVENLFELI